MNDEAQQEILF